ncbi:MAG TPA: hypothetical protein VL135_16215 [Terracidiphilus sp.]|jgi:hypothetical protein|nr:hypothetical protein [Terracidiphilus sp.]
MPRVALAEWILSLTLAPDRATTTVGDLIEDASTRGVLWFWSSVLRTTLSHLLRDLGAYPLRIARLALWGLLMEGVLGILHILPVIAVWQWILDHWGPIVDNQTTEVPQWGASILSIVFGVVIIPFLVGWMVADRSGGRELAAAFALNVVGAAPHFLFIYLLSLQVHRPGNIYPTAENTLITLCVRPLFVTAGAVFFRNYGPKRLRVTEGN